MMPVAAMNFCQWTSDFLLPPSDARWIDEATWAAAKAGFDGNTASEEGDGDGAAEIVGDGEAGFEGGGDAVVVPLLDAFNLASDISSWFSASRAMADPTGATLPSSTMMVARKHIIEYFYIHVCLCLI